MSTGNLLQSPGVDCVSAGMPLVDRFQNEANIFVFLISTLAGGTGLTLTAANKVVVFGN